MTMNSHENPKLIDPASIGLIPPDINGKDYWQSLNELADREDFEELVNQEFPRQAHMLQILSRRDFLKLLGASLGLAGLASCAQVSGGQIFPYTNAPQELTPAKTIPFASTYVQRGYGQGVVVTTTMGRPIKVDGNPNHPDSQGGSDPFMQASVLDLYDPNRAKQVKNQGTQKTWQDFNTALSQALSGLGQGAGLRIVTGPVTSPTLNDQLKALLAKFPQAKWLQFTPVGQGNAQAGANQAFGQPYQAIYDFSKADVVLSLDCDFMFSEPGNMRYSRDFMARHQPISTNGTMSRLYMVEGSSTLTGANADHRLPVKPSQVEAFAQAIASRLGINVTAPSGQIPGQNWLDPLAADLKNAGSAALVVAGERQPAVVHALAHAMNQALGSVGNTVRLVQPVVFNIGDPNASLSQLVQDLNGGAVDLLVMLEENPVYSAPADLNFPDAMKKAKQSIYWGLYEDETAAQATWFIPAAHYLEMWGDASAFDGTVSITQPIIAPLYGGKSPYELIAALNGQSDAKGYDIVRQFWQGQIKGGNFDQTWNDILNKGVVPNTGAQAPAGALQVNTSAFGQAAAAPTSGMEIVFEPDYTVWDGRYANNAWLQETPKPLTKLTWDNAALMNPKTAANLSVADNDVVELKLKGRSVQAPVLIQPSQPEDVVVVSLGYGRKSGGEILKGAGFDAYSIRTSQAPWFDSGLEVSKTGKTYKLATIHETMTQRDRPLVLSATLEEYQKNPKFAQTGEIKTPTLYGEYPETGYQWGMAINLNSCMGCNACVLACQAENNIPSVGKDQVDRGRIMQWLRIDRYYQGSVDNPQVEIALAPIPCMHCEKAPCEPVCPVQATTHSAEGINEMTYNRCVGTRYCSNNCPYKVRRFNFYKFSDFTTESLKAVRNPEVSVRMRGVMEKCTYCIQRIDNARIQAEVEGRQIKDGEVKTACQQACPTGAIIFGNINDPNSAVRKLKDTPLDYGMLAEVGTWPRTTYQARVTNPNPSIQEQA